MAKQYAIAFGNGALTTTSGLAPTFIHFIRLDTGGTLTPPGITQIIANVGAYKFEYTPSFPIYFEIDGATTGLGSARYIKGQLDPIDRIDEIVEPIGTSLGALSSTMSSVASTLAFGMTSILGSIGTTASSFGTNVTDPATLYGYLKRLQEVAEGDGAYAKASGVWTIYDRAGSVTLAIKTLSDGAAEVTKT